MKHIVLYAVICVASCACLFITSTQNSVANDFSLVGPDTTTRIPQPQDCAAIVLADLTSMDEEDRIFHRYIWVPDGKKESIAAVNFTANTACSHASTIVHPRLLANGQVLAYDLRKLAPKLGDLQVVMQVWENLAAEPYFHIKPRFIPPTFVEAKQSDPINSVRLALGAKSFFVSSLGKVYAYKHGAWELENAVELNTFAYGAHVGLQRSTMILSMTRSAASMCRYDYFITKALSTIDGGLYYKFQRLDENGKRLNQTQLLERLGVSVKDVQNIRSDQRVAVFSSRVTGKPRRVDLFQGSSVRPGTGTGIVRITFDPNDNNVDPSADPIRNLLNLKDDGREFIAEKTNGMHIYALFAGDEQLVDEAPPELVADHEIPAPYTRRLQPAISCIRCHAPFEGVQTLKNDVDIMLKGPLDIFDDIGSKSNTADVLDRLAGLYSGNFDRPTRRIRDDFNAACYQATGGIGAAKISKIVSDIYAAYNFEMVDAKVALAELGYITPPGKEVEFLRTILPPLQPDLHGISPEDPVIAALKSGLSITRPHFEQIYGDAALRILQNSVTKE